MEARSGPLLAYILECVVTIDTGACPAQRRTRRNDAPGRGLHCLLASSWLIVQNNIHWTLLHDPCDSYQMRRWIGIILFYKKYQAKIGRRILSVWDLLFVNWRAIWDFSWASNIVLAFSTIISRPYTTFIHIVSVPFHCQPETVFNSSLWRFMVKS